MCKQKERGKAEHLVFFFIIVQGEAFNMEQGSVTGITSRIRVSSVARGI